MEQVKPSPTFCSRSIAVLAAFVLVLVACAPADEPDVAAEPEDDVADPDEEPEEPVAVDEPISLTYAFFAPAVTFPAQQMEQWAQRLEDRTGGMVQVETFPGATLLDAPGMYDGVLEGVADIGLGSPGYDIGRFPLLSGIALPVGFPNSTVASLTLWDLIEEFQPAELTDDFKILAAFTTEPGYVQTNFPVESLEDLEGRTLRAAGSGIPVLQALGADPIGMPMPEVPEALATGAIDGNMTSREVLMDFGIAEDLCCVVNNYPTVVVSFAAVMARDQWEQLPPDVQEIMEELGGEMALWTGEYHDTENVGAAIDWSLEEHGIELTELPDEEITRWDEQLEPLVDEWVEEIEGMGLPAREFLDRLQELRDQYAAEHS
jgi:TRAP-type transport system periplasmic protein